MATVTNNFNTGVAAGTTITTANSDDNGAGDAFDLVSAAGTKTFETRDSGLYGLFTSSGSGQSYFEYSTSVGTVTTGNPVYGSADILLPALPGAGSGGTRIALILTATDTFVAEWRISETGALEQRTGAGGLQNTSVNTITAGQWFKVHVSILNLSGTVGQLQCRLFLDPNSNSPTETLTSAANLNLGSGSSAAKYRFGTARTLTDFATGVDNVRWSTTSQLPVEAGVLIGPVCGNVTDDSFTVMYRTSDSAGQDHRLVVSTSSDLSSPVYSSVELPDADGFVKLDITGLSDDTLYYYGVEVDSVLLSVGRGQVYTDPLSGVPASFSVAFGSCQYDSPTTTTFTEIKDYSGPYGQVRRLIHMGDLNYRDWGPSTTAADIIGQHQTSLASASMSPLLSEVSLTYAWDNHDWAGSFSDKTAVAGPLVAATYRQVFPHYALPATDGVGIWHSWVIGRVRFIQIDPRSQRDAYNAPNSSSKTMLGVEQKAWFKAQLQQPEPVKIICGNMYWRHDAALGDRWGSFPHEFTELNDFIDASAIGLVYVIFGDRHALCADDGTTTATRGRPQAGGAPFQQGSTPVSEVWSQGYYDDPGTMHAFGLLHIDDSGGTITIDYEGKTSLDMITRISMTTIVELDQEVFATSVAPTAALGTPTASRGPVTVTPDGIATGEAFGLPTTFTGPVTVTPAGIGSNLAFGLPVASEAITVTATSVAPTAALGTPTITPAPVTVNPTSIDPAVDFGEPTVTTGPITVTATSVAPTAAVGVPAVGNIGQFTQATSVPPQVAFGLPTLTPPPVTVEATSVEPVAAVGTPLVYTGLISVSATGVGSELDFGLPQVTVGEVTVTATSVPPTAGFGYPSVTRGPAPGQTVFPEGIAATGDFGLPVVATGAVTIYPWPVESDAVVGVPSISTGQVTLFPVGIVSGEAFGNAHIIGGNDGQVVFPASVMSGEAFGLNVLAYQGGGGNCECAVHVGH